MFCIMRKDENGDGVFVAYDKSNNTYSLVHEKSDRGMSTFNDFNEVFRVHDSLSGDGMFKDMQICKLSFNPVDVDIINFNLQRIQNNISELNQKIASEKNKIKTILSASDGIENVEWDAPLSESEAKSVVIDYIFQRVYASKCNPGIYAGDVVAVKPNGYVSSRTNNLKKFDVTVTIDTSLLDSVREMMFL